MRKILALATCALLLVAISGFTGWRLAKYPTTSLLVPQVVKEKVRPLDRYTYEALANRDWQPSSITIEGPLDYKPTTVKPPYKFKSYVFSIMVDHKRFTNQINLPNQLLTTKSQPLILMFRGYAPAQGYETGVGTRPSASVFAQNGFITVAPNFLGYGGSDPRDEDEMTARFESYPIALTTLASAQNLKVSCSLPEESCPALPSSLVPSSLFLWGHSNGGHLAIATVEIANHSASFEGKTFPTVLWGPVSKPFPYSTLAYTDEADDLGKSQRKSLAIFEETYDVNLYSVHSYLDWIKSPIQVHQGALDEEVPYWWSNEFVQSLREKKKEVSYFLYPGANHTLQPGWDTVVAQSLAFFRKHTE